MLLTDATIALVLWLADPVPALPSYNECQRRAEQACLALESWRKAHAVGGGWALQQRVEEAEVWARFWVLALSVRTTDNPMRWEAALRLGEIVR